MAHLSSSVSSWPSCLPVSFAAASEHSQQEENHKYKNRDLQCISPVETATLGATLIILLAFRVNVDQPIQTATVVFLEPRRGLAARTERQGRLDPFRLIFLAD